MKKQLTVLLIILLFIPFITLILGLKAFFSPSPTIFKVSRQTVIKQIQSLQRLETASFTIEKVIDAGTSGNVFQEFLFGDQILLIAHGEVIAGFDLSILDDKSIQIDGDTIRLTLPAAEILVSKLNNEETRVYDRKQGLLTKGNKDLESKARKVAEDTIKQAACNGGILQEASKNGRNQLTTLLKALEYKTVIINIPQGKC